MAHSAVGLCLELWELRWPDPERKTEHPGTAIRALFVAHPTDEWYVFTVLGNKASAPHGGRDWYDVAVDESDRIVGQAIAALGLQALPSE